MGSTGGTCALGDAPTSLLFARRGQYPEVVSLVLFGSLSRLQLRRCPISFQFVDGLDQILPRLRNNTTVTKSRASVGEKKTAFPSIVPLIARTWVRIVCRCCFG